MAQQKKHHYVTKRLLQNFVKNGKISFLVKKNNTIYTTDTWKNECQKNYLYGKETIGELVEKYHFEKSALREWFKNRSETIEQAIGRIEYNFNKFLNNQELFEENKKEILDYMLLQLLRSKNLKEITRKYATSESGKRTIERFRPKIKTGNRNQDARIRAKQIGLVHNYVKDDKAYFEALLCTYAHEFNYDYWNLNIDELKIIKTDSELVLSDNGIVAIKDKQNVNHVILPINSGHYLISSDKIFDVHVINQFAKEQSYEKLYAKNKSVFKSIK